MACQILHFLLQFLEQSLYLQDSGQLHFPHEHFPYVQQLKYKIHYILPIYYIFYSIYFFLLEKSLYIHFHVHILSNNFLDNFLSYLLMNIFLYNNVLFHKNDFCLHGEILKCIFSTIFIQITINNLFLHNYDYLYSHILIYSLL